MTKKGTVTASQTGRFCVCLHVLCQCPPPYSYFCLVFTAL